MRLGQHITASAVELLVTPSAQVSPEDSMEGYRHLLRAEEVWLLARRKQSFTNWYTKLNLDCREHFHGFSLMFSRRQWDARQSGSGLQLAEAWAVNVSKHVIRKSTYKGRRPHVLKDRLRVTFDGCTLPAAVFTDLSRQT